MEVNATGDLTPDPAPAPSPSPVSVTPPGAAAVPEGMELAPVGTTERARLADQYRNQIAPHQAAAERIKNSGASLDDLLAAHEQVQAIGSKGLRLDQVVAMLGQDENLETETPGAGLTAEQIREMTREEFGRLQGETAAQIHNDQRASEWHAVQSGIAEIKARLGGDSAGWVDRLALGEFVEAEAANPYPAGHPLHGQHSNPAGVSKAVLASIEAVAASLGKAQPPAPKPPAKPAAKPAPMPGTPPAVEPAPDASGQSKRAAFMQKARQKAAARLLAESNT